MPDSPVSAAPVSAAPVSAAPVSAAPVSAAPVSAAPDEAMQRYRELCRERELLTFRMHAALATGDEARRRRLSRRFDKLCDRIHQTLMSL